MEAFCSMDFSLIPACVRVWTVWFVLDHTRAQHFAYLGLNVQKMFITGEPQYPAERTLLATGAIDAAEFLGPWSDSANGFQRVADYYYFPGFNKPNGTAEGLVNAAAYHGLPEDLQAIVDAAFAAENDFGLAEAKWFNANSLSMLDMEGTRLEAMPQSIMDEAERVTIDVLNDRAASDSFVSEVLASYRDASTRLGRWTSISEGIYNGRG